MLSEGTYAYYFIKQLSTEGSTSILTLYYVFLD